MEQPKIFTPERIKRIIDVMILIILLVIVLRYNSEVNEIEQQCNDYIIEVNEYMKENCNLNNNFIFGNETFINFEDINIIE